MQTNYSKGKKAEYIALLYLLSKGYRFVAKNYITGRGTQAGEIDLIVKKDNVLVFVEVKERQTLEAAAYAISERQQQRLIKGAEAFLQQNPQYQNFDIRFDAVLIKYPFHITHIKNAWMA